MNMNRNDELELREKILNVATDESKRLGINKSTLWYIKKNLSEGKGIFCMAYLEAVISFCLAKCRKEDKSRNRLVGGPLCPQRRYKDYIEKIIPTIALICTIC